MYLINKNEIRISKFLKGGAFVSLAKSNSFDTHPIEGEIYSYDRRTNLINGKYQGEFGYLLNFDDKFDYNRVRPLFGQEIDFEKFNQNMLVTIMLTLNLFAKYSEFLQNDDDLNNPVLPGPNANVNREEAKKIRKKLVILGISVLKVLGLYDHNENKFVEFDDFKKVVGEGSGIDTIVQGINWAEHFKNDTPEKEPKQVAKFFELNFIEVDTTMAPPNNYRLWTISPSQTGISANYSNVDNFIKDSIEKEISFKETHRNFWGIYQELKILDHLFTF